MDEDAKIPAECERMIICQKMSFSTSIERFFIRNQKNYKFENTIQLRRSEHFLRNFFHPSEKHLYQNQNAEKNPVVGLLKIFT